MAESWMLRSQQFLQPQQQAATDAQTNAIAGIGQAASQLVPQMQEMAMRKAESQARLEAFEIDRQISQRKLAEMQAIDMTKMSYLQTKQAELAVEQNALAVQAQRAQFEDYIAKRKTRDEIDPKGVASFFKDMGLESEFEALGKGLIKGDDGLWRTRKSGDDERYKVQLESATAAERAKKAGSGGADERAQRLRELEIEARVYSERIKSSQREIEQRFPPSRRARLTEQERVDLAVLEEDVRRSRDKLESLVGSMGAQSSASPSSGGGADRIITDPEQVSDAAYKALLRTIFHYQQEMKK